MHHGAARCGRDCGHRPGWLPCWRSLVGRAGRYTAALSVFERIETSDTLLLIPEIFSQRQGAAPARSGRPAISGVSEVPQAPVVLDLHGYTGAVRLASRRTDTVRPGRSIGDRRRKAHSEGLIMTLSRQARELAAEIRLQDWSDAPYRADRAGHNRQHDSHAGTEQLTPAETGVLRMNVMWVVAQALGYADPNFDEYDFAQACGVNIYTRSGRQNGGIAAGLRRTNGCYHQPGTYSPDPADTMATA